MEKASSFKLGIFVLAGVATLIALLLIFGGGRWFTRSYGMETYFDESVQGLDVGSKVRYRGVVVGDVRRLSFTFTRYELDKPFEQRKRYVLVDAALRPELIGIASFEPRRLQEEVAKGLRVRITAQGITGQMYLEIDYVDPKANPPLPIDWTPEEIYIPSAQSTVRQFIDSVEALLERLQKFDIEGTMGNINRLVVAVTKQIEDLQLGPLAKRATDLLAKVDRIPLDKLGNEATELVVELRRSNAQLQSVLANPAWQKFPEDAAVAAHEARELLSSPEVQDTLTRLSRTVRRLDQLVGSRDADLANTLDNLKQITDNLRDLSENVKRYPGNLIFTQPPAPADRGGAK
jgi:paraquat-inducible protein B